MVRGMAANVNSRNERDWNEKKPAASPEQLQARCKEINPNCSVSDWGRVLEPHFGDGDLSVGAPVHETADKVSHPRPVFLSYRHGMSPVHSRRHSGTSVRSDGMTFTTGSRHEKTDGIGSAAVGSAFDDNGGAHDVDISFGAQQSDRRRPYRTGIFTDGERVRCKQHGAYEEDGSDKPPRRGNRCFCHCFSMVHDSW